MLITVRNTAAENSPVLAGARIPFQKIRLPLRFKLTAQNALGPDVAAAWKQAMNESDLFVEVVVCREEEGEDVGEKRQESREPVCRTASNSLQARGVAKFLRLQNGAILRAPVSLALE